MTAAGLAFLGLVAIVPASDLAMALINRMVMAILGPRPLPRMALAERYFQRAANYRGAAVTVTSQQGIDEQVESHPKFTIWRIRMMTCVSPWSRTGEMPRVKVCRVMPNCWRRQWRGSRT